jgi:hypothetical protein
MEVVSSDLVTFVRARLDEDEQVALSTGPETIWRPDSAWATDLLNPLPSQRRDHPGYMPMITTEDLEHIARHDPARVLREVQAARALVRRYEEIASLVLPYYPEERDQGYAEGLEAALRATAMAWSDHPDYQAKWAP